MNSPYRIPGHRPDYSMLRPRSHIFTCAALAIAVGITGPSVVACSATQGQVITAAGAQLLECVATQVLSGGITDPIAIVTACGATGINDVVAIIDAIIAGKGAPASSSPQYAKAVALAKSDLGFAMKLRAMSERGHATMAAGK